MTTTRFDELSEQDLQDVVMEFFGAAGDKSKARRDIECTFHCLAPRLNFLKNLPEGATLLDLGAGDGSLSNFRKWPQINREDLRMLALSLERGAHFDNYEGVELTNFETADVIFPGEMIDAVVCCHFIEHMSDPVSTIKFLSNRLEKGARVYFEWPHAVSKKMPRRDWMIANGINISTTRFDDDDTHTEAWDSDLVAGLLRDHGFTVETVGRVVMPHAASQLRDASENDEVSNTLAFWAYFGWAQYIIAERGEGAGTWVVRHPTVNVRSKPLWQRIFFPNKCQTASI